MKYIIYGLIAMLLMSGCVRRVASPLLEMTDMNDTKPRGSLYQQRSEGLYKLKAEPYSISSKKSDPELLGPQTTINRTKATTVKRTTITTPKPKSSNSAMTKSECIRIVGQDKFDKYSKKFGGDKGVLKRCAIIKKLRRR